MSWGIENNLAYTLQELIPMYRKSHPCRIISMDSKKEEIRNICYCIPAIVDCPSPEDVFKRIDIICCALQVQGVVYITDTYGPRKITVGHGIYKNYDPDNAAHNRLVSDYKAMCQVQDALR